MNEETYGSRFRIGNAVREHSVALSLIGLGVAWYFWSTRSAHGGGTLGSATHSLSKGVRRAGERVRDAAEGAYERANDTVRHAAEYMRDHVSADAVKDTASEWTQAGTGRVSQTAQTVTELLNDYPLVGGALSLAAGIIVGASLPATRTEDRWMGEAADRTYDRLKVSAEDAIDRGIQAAESALSSATDAAARGPATTP